MKIIKINIEQDACKICGLLFLLIGTLLITGCVTTSTLVKPSETNSAVEFTEKLQTSTSAGLDIAMLSVAREKKTFRGYIRLDTYWCPRHKKVYGTQAVKKEYEKYCAAKGGRYLSPFCINTEDRDDVLFFANVSNSRKCGKYQTAQVVVIEPTGPRNSRGYTAVLRQLGFSTSVNRENARINAETRAMREAMRLKRELPLMRNIGTKICKDDRRYTHVGYVEKVAGEKIQIRVANIHFKGRPDLQPGGFSPSIIWDSPQNWYVCE